MAPSPQLPPFPKVRAARGLYARAAQHCRRRALRTLDLFADVLRTHFPRSSSRQPLSLELLEDRETWSTTPLNPALSALPCDFSNVYADQQSVRFLAPAANPARTPTQSIAPITAVQRELVVVDPRVPNAQQLVSDFTAQQDAAHWFDIVYLNPDENGVAQLTSILNGAARYDAVHIIAHGTDGAAQLGDVWLSDSNLTSYSTEIQGWSLGLVPKADLLFYGCDVAADPAGQNLLWSISALTGANVAANTSPTGASCLGGDWTLDYKVGDVHTTVPLTAQQEDQWHYVLSATPAGREFQVNTFSKGQQQTFPQVPEAVGMNPATGDFVIAWSSQGQIPGSGWDVYFQRFNAAGIAQGGETLVDTAVNGANQQYASVAMGASGAFVVTWSSNQGGHWAIYAQMYDASGNPLGGNFQVSAASTMDQQFSTVAMDGNGNFVITWTANLGPNTSIFAQRYSSTGAALGANFQVNAAATAAQQTSTVAYQPDGDFIVTWSGHQSGHWDIYAQIFSTNGTAIGSQFEVDSSTSTYDHVDPTIAVDPISGDFAISWSGHPPSNHWLIFARSYDATGAALTGDVQICPTTNNDQEWPSIASVGSGGFAITWSSNNQDGNGWGVYAQLTDSTLAPVGGELLINTYTHDNQQYSSIASTSSGAFVVAWSSNNQDGNGWGVYGQRFNSNSSRAGILVTPATPLQTEAGDSPASFQVMLSAAPTANVTLTFTLSNPTQGALSTYSLTFTPTTWNQAQTVEVTGLDNHIVNGGQTYQINGVVASADPNYDQLSMSPVVVVNEVNDIAAIATTPTSLTTSEKGTSAFFSVTLTSIPSAPVMVNLGTSVSGQGSLSQSVLTFNASNWNTPQTIIVTGLDDQTVNGDQTYTITGSAASSDTNYNGLSMQPVTVVNTEADVAGFTVTPSSLQTSTAGGSATFDVTLTSIPSAPVTVVLNSSILGEGVLSPSILIFDASNWNVAQTVAVTGQLNLLTPGNVSYQIVGTATSADANYNLSTTPAVNLLNVNTATPGVVVTPTSLETSEAGTSATFGVALTSAPLFPVRLNFVVGNPAEGALSPSSVTFTPANWYKSQSVQVTGLDDHIVNGDQTYLISGTASSSDPIYNGMSVTPVSVVNKEADTAGFNLSTTQLTTSESGTTATFAVALASEPIAPVLVNLTTSMPGQGSLSTYALNFNSTNWNVPQEVTVTGLDDHVVNGDQTYFITGSGTSSDPIYNGLSILPITVTNTEADVPGILVNPTSLSTYGPGSSASFTVELQSKPQAPVSITLQPTNVNEGTVAPGALVFDSTDWNVSQTVTISGLDDGSNGANVSYQVTGVASSADAVYDTMSMTPVQVININPHIGLNASSITSVYGQTITLDAAVTAAGYPKTGTVTFMDGTATLGIVTLNSVTAAFSTSGLTAGQHTITAIFTSSGSSVDHAETSVAVTVNPAVLTVTALNKSRTYGAPDPVFSYLVSGFLNGDTASVLSGQPSLTTTALPSSNVGIYSIMTGVGTLKAANYSFVFVNGVLTINPAVIKVAADNATRTYGQANPAFTYSISGLVNQDTAAVINGSPVLTTSATAVSPVGNYQIKVGLGSLNAENYTFALVNGELGIMPATLTVTVNNAGRQYGAPDPAFSYSITGFVNGETASIVGGAADISTGATQASPVGTYPIAASVGTLSAANYAFVFVDGALTISRATLTVSANDIGKTYGAPNPPLTYSITGFVNGDAGDVVTGYPVLSTNATLSSSWGTYPIYVSFGTLSAANYDFALVDGTLTIEKATLTVTPVSAAREYGQPNPAISYTVTGFVNGDTVAVVHGSPIISTTATANSPVGVYTVVAQQGTLTAPQYFFAFNIGTLTVNPAPLTVVAGDVVRSYGQPDPTFPYALSGFVNGDSPAVVSGVPSFATNESAGSGVGTYSVIPGTGSLTAQNYTFIYTPGRVTVHPAILQVVASNLNRVYGEPNPNLVYSISGFANGDTVSVVGGGPDLTTTATAASGVGAYAISISAGTLVAANYAFSLTDGTLDVNPATLTVTADSYSRSVGQANPSLGYTITGFVNGDTTAAVSGAPNLSTTAGRATGAGSYLIVASIGSLAAQNYQFAFINGQLTVTAGPVAGQSAFNVPATSTGSGSKPSGVIPSALLGPGNLGTGSSTGGSVVLTADRVTRTLESIISQTVAVTQFAGGAADAVPLSKEGNPPAVENAANSTGQVALVAPASPSVTLPPVGGGPGPSSAAAGSQEVARILAQPALWQQLDKLSSQVAESESIRVRDMAVVTSVVASAGYVLLTGRGLTLLVSLLTARPLWSRADPLEILFAWEEEKKRQGRAKSERDEETLSSLAESLDDPNRSRQTEREAICSV